MLRRKPTALTISPEDLQAFEDLHTRKLALARYKKTGEDPNGWFTSGKIQAQTQTQTQMYYQHMQDKQRGDNLAVDPSDELKPLPGDKARIVRSREERIVGNVGGNGN